MIISELKERHKLSGTGKVVEGLLGEILVYRKLKKFKLETLVLPDNYSLLVILMQTWFELCCFVTMRIPCL